MHDPQQDVDNPERFIVLAEKRIEEDILTSVDEEAYCNGDWTEKILEIAGEFWAEAEQKKKDDEAEHHLQQYKDRNLTCEQ